MKEILFKDIKKDKMEKLSSLKEGCWINIEGASHEDLEYVAKITNLNVWDIEDALDMHELPRIERDGDNVILFIRDTQEQDREGVYTTPLTVIINSKYIISISPVSSRTIRSIVEGGSSFLTTQSSNFLMNLLLVISKNFTRGIKNIRSTVLKQKGELKKVKGLDIIKLIEGEEILNQYISALTPMKIAIEAISKGGYIHLYEKDNDLLEDMSIAIRQSVDNCTVSVKSIKNLRDSYQAIFTNNLNNNIRLLTSLTVILTIPTIVGSLFGMNIPLPFAESESAFVFIVLAIFLIAFGFYIILKRKDWI
ncbi:MAG: magnesium transporter CorA family protein [Minisyncoccales bacterium]